MARSQRDGYPREQLPDDGGDVRRRAGLGQQPMGERVGATALTSSGITWSRPSEQRAGLAEPDQGIPARGLAPSARRASAARVPQSATT